MKLKVGKYYSVYLDTSVCKPGNYVGKYIEKRIGYPSYLFEFISNINGHDGSSGKIGGKWHHCWWIAIYDIKKKLTDDEAMVEVL